MALGLYCSTDMYMENLKLQYVTILIKFTSIYKFEIIVSNGPRLNKVIFHMYV